MKFISILLLIIASICCLCHGSVLPDHIQSSVFPDRSGQIIIGSEELPSFESRSSLFIQEEFLAEDIAEENVGNLLAHLSGFTAPLNFDASVDRSAFPRASSVFHKPTASLLVAFDNLSAEELPFSTAFETLSSLSKITVRPSVASGDCLSTLETMLTSSPPSFHGMVRKQWMDHRGHAVRAFIGDEQRALPFATSLADVLSQSEHESLIYAVSGSSQLASALGVSPNFGAENAYSYSWDHATYQFVDRRRQRGAFPVNLLDIDEPMALIKQVLGDRLSVGEWRVDNLQQQLIVTVDESPLTFNLNALSVSMMFAEIHMLEDLTTLVESGAFSADTFSDYMAVGVSSLELIRAEFGQSSAQFKLASALIQSSLQLASKRIAQAYADRGGKLVRSVLFVQSALLPDQFEKAKRILSSDQWLEDIAALPVQHTFPELYLSHSLSKSQIAETADQINTILQEHTSLHAYYLPIEQMHAQHDQHMKKLSWSSSSMSTRDQQAAEADEDDGFTQTEVNNFQIILWMSILLILFAFFASLTMCSLHWEGMGSGLYIETTTVNKDHIE
eukprot:CAMPEP_0201552320 /NCGR_PEP_ID=MMETSP0173_2-20130828/14998_1 /ASSEMBLY_ACC=CAM_ASM_000268 /TAXON_ID=218659 /ORGANISM="Vexillifera sp., Strain DIVA3 564/2" /LENGTH=560 /DNA_ID=CAMNT_0047962781 /DNA_START=6 /DNA_END=1688 /DNA_ORIENTATION=+